MRQLQFKFDPLPAESAEICLFHERWIKTFYTQNFSQLCIKYVPVFYKIDLVQFCNKYMEVLHQKTSFWALEKWKMVSSSKENENFLRKHCLPFQYAPLRTIWDHLNKLCHECGHKIDHLAWKQLISTHDSSFLRTLFKNNYRITSLFFFLGTWPHIMTQCEGFPILFFEFFMPVLKCGQNSGNDHS